MGLKEVATALKKFLPKPQPVREFADDETKDKVLRTLRRQRRTQMEEEEKVRLRKAISDYQTARDKKYIFGVGDKKVLSKGDGLRKDDGSIMKNDGTILKNRARFL